jgi:hypothetical protein
MLVLSSSQFVPQRSLVQRELAEIVATPTRISLYGDGESCGYSEECRYATIQQCFRGIPQRS